MTRILIFLFTVLGFAAICQEVTVCISLDAKKEMECRGLAEGGIIELGELTLGSKKDYVLKIQNTEKATDFRVMSILSTCSCISFQKASLPLDIKAASSVNVTFSVDTSGYWGPITKTIRMSVQQNEQTREFLLPFKFSVVDEQKPASKRADPKSEQKNGNIRYVEYTKRTDEDEKEASAWLFSSKNCHECEITKTMILPQLFSDKNKKYIVIQVNIDEEDGLKLLLDIHNRFGTEEIGDFPALFFQSVVIYGKNEILKRIEGTRKNKCN